MCQERTLTPRTRATGRAAGWRPSDRRERVLRFVMCHYLRSAGWFTPSLVGTFGIFNGLTPSRQATLKPYCVGFDLR